ncbi:MAG: GLPGLI family protein [Bacteroidetes bacterium]|nr:GLPGLI family protein [Bacteroidota bacterium]
MQKHTILKISLLICIMQVLTNHIHAQFFDAPTRILDSANLKIGYTLTWKEDTNNLERIRNENMILLVGENISLFMGENFYNMTYFGRKAEREGRLQQFIEANEMEKYRTRFSYRIYKNFPESNYTYNDKVIPDYLEYTEDFSVFKWELSDQTETIGNYNAQRANCFYGGRNWVAWYTTEIPINDGPYKFYGLPGLIIKMYDANKHYVFEMTEIERYKNWVSIEYEDRGWIQTSRADFLKAQKNFKLDIINRAKDAGANAVSQQRVYRNMMKKNNPIEF